MSAAPVVVVVGASQESVATPLPTGRSCGLLVVEPEDGSLSAPEQRQYQHRREHDFY